MRVDRGTQLVVPLRRLRTRDRDVQPHRAEPCAHRLVDAEQAPRIQIALRLHVDVVDLDAERRPIVVTLIVSFVTAWVSPARSGSRPVLRRIVPSERPRHGRDPLGGIYGRAVITRDQLDRRTTKLTVLNCAQELVTIVIMALIIAVWPPA